MSTPQQCKRHGIIGCHECLKRCVEELLDNTMTAGDGGFIASFGIILFEEMTTLTGHGVMWNIGDRSKYRK